MTCSAWARWVWHRIGGDDDAAQVDPVQQRGERGDFVALRGDLTLGDHRLAGVERGGEQVHGVGIGGKHLPGASLPCTARHSQPTALTARLKRAHCLARQYVLAVENEQLTSDRTSATWTVPSACHEMKSGAFGSDTSQTSHYLPREDRDAAIVLQKD